MYHNTSLNVSQPIETEICGTKNVLNKTADNCKTKITKNYSAKGKTDWNGYS